MEIYTTEMSFVRSLIAIVDVLMPLFDSQKQALKLPDDVTSSIFANAPHIRAINAQFLTTLHARMQSWNPESTCVGDCFQLLVRYSKPYVEYYKNYESVPGKIEQLRSKNKKFDLWLKHPDIDRETGGQGLLQLLIQPCQRFMRYNLLIAELLKQTPDTHPDYESLKEASAAISRTTTAINLQVENKQLEQKVAEMRKGKDYVGFEEFLSHVSTGEQPGRQLRHCSSVTIALGQTEYTWMSLWTDALVVASDTTDKKGHVKKKFETSLPLEHCWVVRGSTDTTLEVITPTDFLNVSLISRDVRNKWIDVAEAVIEKRISELPAISYLSATGRRFELRMHEGLYKGDWELGKYCGEATLEYRSGAVYVGQFQRGKRHGSGRMTYDAKSYYEGDWESDLPHGTGTLDNANTGVYTGQWEKGRKHGNGRMTWVNNDVYEGNWAMDAMSGQGLLTFCNGFVYEGEFAQNAFHGLGKLSSFGNVYVGGWVSDRKEGTGTMDYSTGDRYEGEWKNDRRHGKGVYTRTNGKLRYDGQWEDDMMHGQGQLVVENNFEYTGGFAKDSKAGTGAIVYVDGSKYTGSWMEDKREGEGEYTDVVSGTTYTGCWHADKRIGKGVEKYADGSEYTGEFYKDKKHGKGKMLFPDGSIYSGDWEYDRRHGRGVFRFTNGASFYGDWDNGMRTGKGEIKDRLGTFDGLWRGDLREGAGQFRSEIDKSTYTGNWKNDVVDGSGVFIKSDGSKLEVSFSEGKVDRPALSEVAPMLPVPRVLFR